MNWIQSVLQVLPFLLSLNAKTAPIADEVTKAVIEAEELFKPGQGADKLKHVLNVATEAAQAYDELRGAPDETVGAVGSIVHAAIPVVNAIAAFQKG